MENAFVRSSVLCRWINSNITECMDFYKGIIKFIKKNDKQIKYKILRSPSLPCPSDL